MAKSRPCFDGSEAHPTWLMILDNVDDGRRSLRSRKLRRGSTAAM